MSSNAGKMWTWSLALASVLLCGLPAQAAEANSSIPVSVLTGLETVKLPGRERLGLASAEVLFELQPGYSLGPVVYGAASGQRGGFFVLGLELQRRWALTTDLELLAGLGLGGGGGGGAPVGNGLMLRPSMALLQTLGPMRAGLSISSVQFPGTAIRSQQFGLVAQWQGDFRIQSLDRVGEVVWADQRSGLGFDQVALTHSQVRLRGAAAPMDFPLVGARAAQRLNHQGDVWGLSAAAAVRQDVAGYMEILGFIGREVSLGERVRLGARAELGLGGGGGVPTGGGLMAKLEGTLSAKLAPGWAAGASFGRIQGPAPGLRGQVTELWLATDLEPVALPSTPGRSGNVVRTEWAGSLQQLVDVARRDGSKASIQTLGLALNRWLTPQVYVSAQAHSAYGGQAGAYSVGLIGAGWTSTALPAPWQVGAELLLGGAGGAGVQGVSGAVAQGLMWAGLTPAGSAQQWRIGFGRAASLRGGGASPIASLTWAVAFGQASR
jgi:hypothetical protein